MKKIVGVLASWMVAALFLSCGKSSGNNDLNNIVGIAGNWILSESYYDRGDGSGNWEFADKSNPEWLNLKSNNELQVNAGRFATYRQYQVVNDSLLVFTSDQGSSIRLRYTLKAGVLTLSPPCRESCMINYRRFGK